MSPSVLRGSSGWFRSTLQRSCPLSPIIRVAPPWESQEPRIRVDYMMLRDYEMIITSIWTKLVLALISVFLDTGITRNDFGGRARYGANFVDNVPTWSKLDRPAVTRCPWGTADGGKNAAPILAGIMYLIAGNSNGNAGMFFELLVKTCLL